MYKKKLVVLTGAGISAESGIKTFRDSDGLWENHRIESVATPEAWSENPALVLDFYNKRRRNVLEAQPNQAHLILASLEQYFDVQIITQNVDDLHERAKSSKILHLHGEILSMRSEKNPTIVSKIRGDIQIGDLASDNAQLRPNIVWFGEAVPMMDIAEELVFGADIFLIVGTSLLVYPAASLGSNVSANTTCIIVDKVIPSHQINDTYITINKPATEGMVDVQQLLLGKYI